MKHILNNVDYLDDTVSQVAEEITLSGVEELDNSNSKTVIDFDDQHAEIDSRKDQRFEEL